MECFSILERITSFEKLRQSGILEFGDGYRAKNSELGGDGPVFLRDAYLQDSGFSLARPDRLRERANEKFWPKVACVGDVVITTKGNSTGRIGLIRKAEQGAIYSPHLSYWRSLDHNPPGDTYKDEGDGLPFFQGRTDFGFRFPENRKFCNAPTRLANQDDTLVSVRAPVGDINIAWKKSCVGRGVAALRHRSGSPSFTYYSAWTIQQELREYEHTGTVFGAINKKQFEALETIEPPSPVITLFDKTVGPLDQRVRANEAESRTLAQTRDLLLPKLMSGDIRLREAERAVEAAF